MRRALPCILFVFVFFVAGLVVNRASQATAPDAIHLAWAEDPATTMTVVWRTLDPNVESVAQYRRAGGNAWQSAKGGIRPSGATGALHEVTLRRLSPSTKYEYRVKGAANWSEAHSFSTAPPPGPASYEVIYVADTGMIGRQDGLATGTKAVIEEIGKLDPALVLLGGDYAYYNTDKRFGSLDDTIEAWFNQMRPIAVKAPMMPTYGNHEIFLHERYLFWAERFPTPEGHDNRRYYSFQVGDAHYLSIMAADSERGRLATQTIRWIEQDMAAARKAGKRWIIPFMHVSAFSDGSNHPSNLELREQLGPVFERYGVKIAIASHDQSYERTFPLRGVPADITATSASRKCYTWEDGVTWLKVSPGGKESNINGKFAEFKTNPAPFWTAFRDNTRHHFARLFLSPNGVRVEIVGVKTGEPSMVQDSFEYTLGKCPQS